MANAFVIVYVMNNIENLGSVGVLLVFIATSLTSLLVSRLILGKDFQDGVTSERRKNRFKTLLVIATVVTALIGFILDNPIVIALGFAFLVPIVIPRVFRIFKRK